MEFFQQYSSGNQSHAELNQKGNNWSINDQVTTRQWCPHIIHCFPSFGQKQRRFFFSFFDDDRFTQITCVTVVRFLDCTARLRSTDNYFCSSLCNILADIFSWEHGKPFWCVTELKEWEKDRSMFCSVLSCLRLTDFIKYIFPQTQPYLNLCVSTYILYKSEGEAGRTT